MKRITVALLMLAVVAGCRPDDQRTDSVDPTEVRQDRASWPAGAAERIDAGNAAIRADSFDVAREHFLEATELAPDIAASWFGLYLAEQGRGDEEAAAAALERARGIQSGATLIHAPEDGGRT